MINQHVMSHLTPFVGRAKEQGEITARLVQADCRLLTLIGLGGSGKTRLAIEVATTVASWFSHGSVFVALQPLPRSDLIVSAVVQAVGLTLYGEDEAQDQLFAYLRDKTLLVILDNFEHLLDGTTFVSALLAAVPGVTVLATSREALRLQEEWLYPLHGLAAPPSVYATSLEEYEAVQLFLSHARRVQPAFNLDREREFVIRLCMLTAGLPLAIELAASWLKGLHTAHIVQALQHNLDVLSTTTRNVELRHRSMRAVFDQSWALLSQNERLIFAKLSVFRGGFASDAAEHVADAALADLAALVEKSLILLESHNRFVMHELLRHYGIEQLDVLGQTEVTQLKHSEYFAALMSRREMELKGAQQLAATEGIKRDFENVRLAWEWSTKHNQVGYLHAMLNGLYLFGFLCSRYHETAPMFQQALDQMVPDVPLLGRLLARRWGYLHWWFQFDYGEALLSIEQGLTIAQAEQNDFEIAFCHLMAAYALINMQRYAEALPHLETSHGLFEALKEPYYVCWVLHRLGYTYFNLNNADTAQMYTERSLVLARATANQIALVICLYNLGLDYILRGDYAKARQHCAEALQAASDSGHQGQIAYALSLLALCAFLQKEYTTGQEYAERSWTIIEDINMLLFQPYNVAALMLVACVREDYAEGVRLKQCEHQYTTNMMGLQLLYWALAAVSCGLGQPEEARAYIQKVLQLSDLRVHTAIVRWINPCAAYTLATTQPTQAVELLAWGSTYPHAALGWAGDWPLMERLQMQLQTMLGHEVYQTHWEKGTSLSLESMTTYLQQVFRATPHPGAEPPAQLLTARERQILGLMAAGKTNPQIAAHLVIGEGTVKTHTLNIYRKLDVANRTQAIMRAQELGLLRS